MDLLSIAAANIVMVPHIAEQLMESRFVRLKPLPETATFRPILASLFAIIVGLVIA